MTARLQDKRIWLGGGVLAAVLMVLTAWFGVISPQLSSASATRADTSAALASNTVLQASNAKLKTQNDNVVALRAQLRAALMNLPFDSGLPQFTQQLSQQATANHIGLTSVVVGAATAVVPSAAAGAAPGAGAANPSATAAPGTGAAAPKVAASGLVAIPISVASTGKGPSQLNFVEALEAGGSRRALVTAVQLSPVAGKSNDGATTLTLQLTVFSAPLDAASRTTLTALITGK